MDALEHRVSLGAWPSPVRDLSTLRDGLWVKDDGHCHPVYAGNKVRKLEYLLADASERIVTFGAMGSHHALATAVHGTDRGHQVSVVMHPRHYTPHAERVLRATMHLADVHRFESHQEALAGLQVVGADATIIPAGGSTPVGALGFARAGLELGEQVAAGELPAPRRIYVAAGSAGTLAGLTVGMRLAGLDTTIVGVRVVPVDWMSVERIHSLCAATGALLGVEPGHWELQDQWLGAGYSAPTPASEQASARAADVSLHLETCYTAKAMAAAMDQSGGPDLFWQTHSQAPLDGLVEASPHPDPAIWAWQSP